MTWKPCPSYTDEVARGLGVAQDKIASFHSLMKRLECGTVTVPLNHHDPAGREIDIAVTRLAATDRTHRLGAITVLPGGPGNSGYLDPILRAALRNDQMAALNEHYDIIGFDPRGVGYSTKAACPTSQVGPQQPGPLTKQSARQIYDAQTAANQQCGRSDPAFLGQLTTENVAKDLDLIRTALGEPELNLLGFSWGTYLGMVYRSLYPQRTGRAFLDSVAPPWTNLVKHTEGAAQAAEANFGRMAAWLARRNALYGLGATTREVRAEVAKLVHAYDRSPRTYSDLPRPIDGSAIADLAKRNSTEWARAGKALAELRTAIAPSTGTSTGTGTSANASASTGTSANTSTGTGTSSGTSTSTGTDASSGTGTSASPSPGTSTGTGTTAPPTVKELLGTGMMGTPVPGAPEMLNLTMNWAVACNEDDSRPTFDTAWRTYQQLVKRFPATGRGWGLGGAMCQGWPLPVQQATLRRSNGSLVLAGHLHEFMSAYDWTLQTHRAVGGTVYTVADDVHVSSTRVPECAADVARYFETGRIDTGCKGTPLPS
ncbi:hypothetical protein GCM10009850_095330 [Nonomuraea monospora]|uniref:Uncharacterized protein n=1 Tax=Nonomuraea monospora TaxID=568818 RepID=A0ABN3CX94_9ACTN